MPNRERRKGREGELEVRKIWESHGFAVRNTEREGDHAVYLDVGAGIFSPMLHSEVKRTERAQPWQWLEQAEREAPEGAVPVVSFRRSHSPWYSIIRTDDLARLLA